MTSYITLRGDLRLLGGAVDEGEIITVPADLDQDTADRLLALDYIAPADQLPEGVEPVDLAALKLDELKAIAAERGIDLGEARTKAAIVELIEKALAAEAAGA